MLPGDWEKARKVSNPFWQLSRVLFSGASEELAGAETVHDTSAIRRLLRAQVGGRMRELQMRCREVCLRSHRKASMGIPKEKSSVRVEKEGEKIHFGLSASLRALYAGPRPG